jgi:hypothetical protein
LHVFLVANANVWLSWTERRDGHARLWVQSSRDAGRTWTVATEIADAAGPADYSYLHLVDGRAVVSWASSRGHQLIDINNQD